MFSRNQRSIYHKLQIIILRKKYGQSFSSQYRQKLLDGTKKSAKDALKTA